jgi:hypothetical protein
MQIDVCKQGRSYAALRRAFLAGSQFPLIHDAAFEKASHELENMWISDTPRYLCD